MNSLAHRHRARPGPDDANATLFGVVRAEKGKGIGVVRSPGYPEIIPMWRPAQEARGR